MPTRQLNKLLKSSNFQTKLSYEDNRDDCYEGTVISQNVRTNRKLALRTRKMLSTNGFVEIEFIRGLSTKGEIKQVEINFLTTPLLTELKEWLEKGTTIQWENYRRNQN